MDKKSVYQQINEFKLQIAKDYDKKDIKDVDKFYWYVDDDEAEDKAKFIKYLIKENILNDSYSNILDLTFGSGNLTSHIVLDGEISYENIVFNDINTLKTNQNIVNTIDNSTITNLDILDTDNFLDNESDLIILNPQIGGGTYPEGDISLGRKEKEYLEQLSSLSNIFLSNNKTLIFYGRSQHFEKIFKDISFIKYKDDTNQLYIMNKEFEKSKCFKSNGEFFQEIDCNSIENNEIEEIEDFDNIMFEELDMFHPIEENFKDNNNILKFSDETKGNLNFKYRNILFKGVPGTGKSRAIDEIIKNHLKIENVKENILRVNIHSASSNSDLMQGIGISTNANGNIKYSEKQGLILDIIKRATFNPNQPFVLILEEIQENSLNELIGDLIYLIEDKKRSKLIADNNVYESYESLVNYLAEKKLVENYVEIPYLVNESTNYKKMIIPDNLFIFCTSNYRDDKKVIEDNLLRRFEVIEIYPNENVPNDYVKKFFEELNQSILEVMKENHEIHPDRFMIGHAIWKDVKNKDTFYKAFSKLITEFKDIREIEFDIFKTIIENLSFPNDIDIEIKDNYYDLIKDIQVNINYEFID